MGRTEEAKKLFELASPTRGERSVIGYVLENENDRVAAIGVTLTTLESSFFVTAMIFAM